MKNLRERSKVRLKMKTIEEYKRCKKFLIEKTGKFEKNRDRRSEGYMLIQTHIYMYIRRDEYLLDGYCN